MTMAKFESARMDLPLDNASRVAIYDALLERSSANGAQGVSGDELFESVIGRLRVLVPRELHLAGERSYVEQKIRACVEAGLVCVNSDEGQMLLALTGRPPLIRYPDGELRDYSPGLELARERLDGDNARLRAAGFNVLEFIPSIADDSGGPAFQGLLASMGEHGFLKQFPVVKYDDGVVIDGRARLRAAKSLYLDVEYMRYGSERERTVARRRDSPLNRVLVAVHSNLGRLNDEAVGSVYEQVSKATCRTWEETASDLALTGAWRRSIPVEYSPVFDVKKLPFREGDEAKIQVTADNKVMLRSLVEAGGLSNYKIDVLRDYVPFERARSAQTAGRKAVFARADDLISGIATMQRERRAAKRKLDPEWEQIRGWLVGTFDSKRG